MSNRAADAPPCRLRSVTTAALCVALLAVPAPAKALEIFGLRLFERDQDAEEEIIGTPQPYAVDFVVEGDDADLENRLQSASRLWADREDPAAGAAGLIAKARGDYRRILDALYAAARYGGTISITIDGREADTLDAGATFTSTAAVRVVIDPGPLFHFAEARIVNNAPPAADTHRDMVDDPAEEGFRRGEPARSGIIIEAGRLSEAAWKHQGYAKAEVIERRVIAAHRNNTIDATLVLDPGRHAVFGPLTVRGTERMNAAFVARQTGITPGTEYDPDDVDQARERLTRLGVFRSARLQEAKTIGDDGTLPIEVVVQERLPRRFGVGGSYSTVDGLGLEAFWLHRNLFGRAEQLRIEGKVAGIGESIDPKDFTYRVGATFRKPGIYTPETDFVASIYGDREVLDIYTRTGVSAEAGFTHRFSEALTGRLFVNAGYGEFEDDFGTRDFITAGFLGGVTYDTRDNPANATEGFFAELTVEPFYEFNYGNAAARIVAESRAYLSLDSDSRFVIAGRVKLGSILEPPIEETPPDRLFLAGGGGSVRGYAHRNIGVELPGGSTGGRSLIETSAELRVRVTDSIGLVGFVDAGYVDESAVPDFSEDLRIGVGGGLRYLTGLGPIRLDVAVPLDPRPEDPSVAFYVGIGQAF